MLFTVRSDFLISRAIIFCVILGLAATSFSTAASSKVQFLPFGSFLHFPGGYENYGFSVHSFLQRADFQKFVPNKRSLLKSLENSCCNLPCLSTAENMFTMSVRKMTAEPMLRVRCIRFRRSIWKKFCLPRWGGCSVHRRCWHGFAMKTLPEF